MERSREYGWRGVCLALVPSGLMTYLWWQFGDLLLPYSEQVESGIGARRRERPG